MSRFKLFGIFTAMVSAIMGDVNKSYSEKHKEIKSINARSGGMLFAGNPYGPKRLNQRQLRKRKRQNPNSY